MPQADHPLTRAYIQGARATDYTSMANATRMTKILEGHATAREIAQCKLAAEVLIERGLA